MCVEEGCRSLRDTVAWGYTRARACQKSGHLDSSPTRQLSNVKRSNLFTEGLEVEVLLLSALSLQRSREVQPGLALGTLKRQVQHPFPPVCTLLAIWGSFLVATGLVCPFGIQPAQRITEQLPLPLPPPPPRPLPLSIPVLRLQQGHFTCRSRIFSHSS